MTDRVSRGTPPPPAVAAELFGRRLWLARRYADLLCGPGVERGLLGPREAAVVWERHLLNCAVVAADLPAGATVADIGSGAGLPGLVWAVQRPDLVITLVEPLLRRSRFLHEAVEQLGLANVTVLRARADDLPESAAYKVVTARAVAPLDRLVHWCLPLVSDDGALYAFKGRSAADELAKTRATLRAMNARSAELKTYGEGVVIPPATVVVVRPGWGRHERTS